MMESIDPPDGPGAPMTAEVSTPTPVTTVLADWVAGLAVGDVPAEVRQRTKDILLDALANALSGRETSEAATIGRLADRIAGPGTHTVIGGRDGVSAASAVLINGYLITATTSCDIHRSTMAHVTPEVVPPALAIGETHNATGDDLLVAIAVGLEVTTRVGLGLDPPGAFRQRGWHTPGIIGPFGGAAAAGRLLHLDARTQRDAFGMAGSQSAGTYAHLGTPTIKFQQSRGALSGLMSAVLAQEGMSAATEVLNDPFGGLFSAFSDGGRPSATLEGLGDDWELMRISLRAWPCGVRLQSMVTAEFDALRQAGVPASEIAEVEVGLPSNTYLRNAGMPWDATFRSRLSAPYVTAVVAMDGACRLEQFTEERIVDAATNAFIAERVRLVDRPDLADGAVVRVTTTSGRSFEARASVAKGDPELPLDWSDVVDKFRSAAVPVLGEARSERVIDMIDGLERVASTADITRHLRPG